jgi:S1-C subfamily serine protease
MITDLSVGGEQAPTPDPEPPKRRRITPELRKRVLISLVVVWAAAITAVVLLRDGDPKPAAAPKAPAPSASAPAPLGVNEVYQTLLPSVVVIQTTGSTKSGSGMAESSTGTGVIVNAAGLILTAEHVISGARSIKISYTDGTSTTATVTSADAKKDIATVTPAKLPETLVPAVLGGGLEVGADVVAIGNPLGLTMSTTDGVVSGLDRTMSREKASDIPGLIQFDAAVNPGSSGGPLLNDQAQVVGIVVALANPTDAGTFIGIGFAVPIGSALGGGEGNGPAAPPL